MDEFKGHGGRTFLTIFNPAGGTEAAFAVEGNKLHFATMGTEIHGATKRRITAMDHLVNVFNNDWPWM